MNIGLLKNIICADFSPTALRMVAGVDRSDWRNLRPVAAEVACCTQCRSIYSVER
jgi:hypothetical protein